MRKHILDLSGAKQGFDVSGAGATDADHMQAMGLGPRSGRGGFSHGLDSC